MVQGMAFLSKKGFNPHNNVNRKLVWEAQQHSKLEKERLRRRQEQLKREQEDKELELATRGEIGGSQAQLRFMYDAPPGMEKDTKNHNDNRDAGSNNNITGKSNSNDDINDLARVKPGDDAAAVAFRQMLAATTSNGDNIEHATKNADDEMLDKDQDGTNKFKFTPSLQGSMVEADSRYNNSGELKDDDAKKKSKALTDSRSALEKEVGRKNRSSQNNLSYEQQIERFPQLKNAPMMVKRGTTTSADGNDEAGTSAPMMVHFKPLGSQILHVRCLACGIWGHARGDRECKKSGWNPFALPSLTPKTKGLDTTTTTSSSILPSKRDDSVKRNEPSRSNEFKESSSSPGRRRSRRRYDSDSDSYDRDRDRRQHRRHRRQRRDKLSDDDDHSDDDDNSSRTHGRRRNKYGQRQDKKYKASRESSRTNPSSEDSSKLKRRNDNRYDSSEDERRNHHRDHRNQDRERHRDREHSKKRSRSKRYESVSSHKKQKKKRRHYSP